MVTGKGDKVIGENVKRGGAGKERLLCSRGKERGVQPSVETASMWRQRLYSNIH